MLALADIAIGASIVSPDGHCGDGFMSGAQAADLDHINGETTNDLPKPESCHPTNKPPWTATPTKPDRPADCSVLPKLQQFSTPSLKSDNTPFT